MKHIVMLLSNPFRPDPRVAREATALGQHGYRVTLVCWDRQGEFPSDEWVEGIEIKRLTIRSAYSAGSRQLLYLPRFWMRAIQELRILKPDLVHCHDLDTTPPGYWYASHHRKPWIFDAHECYPEQIGPQVHALIYYLLLWLEKWMSRRATHVITVGEMLAQRFRNFGAQVTIVGNYPTPEQFGQQPVISRQDLGIPAETLLVAYIGGFTLAREIIPLIKATRYVDDITVLLAGDGPQRASIEAELPHYPHVRYLGWLPHEQIPAYTALADVIYYGLKIRDGNSQYSTPNALFNAMAAGKPIITTEVGEIADIVETEQCGVIVSQAEPVLLAEAMHKLKDPGLRARLSENARRAAHSKYNWRRAQANLLALYHDILGNPFA